MVQEAEVRSERMEKRLEDLMNVLRIRVATSNTPAEEGVEATIEAGGRGGGGGVGGDGGATSDDRRRRYTGLDAFIDQYHAELTRR